MSTDEAVAWLRKQVDGDLERWQKDLDRRRSLVVNVPGVGAVATSYADLLTGTAEPEDRVADCEAKLRLLDEHHILAKSDTSERYEELSIYGGQLDHGCITCHYTSQGAVKGDGICLTLGILATAYRHRDGYAGHWGD